MTNNTNRKNIDYQTQITGSIARPKEKQGCLHSDSDPQSGVRVEMNINLFSNERKSKGKVDQSPVLYPFCVRLDDPNEL